MDPITAGLKVLDTLLQFGLRVYDDTPVALRVQGAADWAKFVHSVASAVLELQSRLTPAAAKTT